MEYLGNEWMVNFDDGEKHNNLSFFLPKETVHFNDVRNFGTFIFCDKKALKKISKIWS